MQAVKYRASNRERSRPGQPAPFNRGIDMKEGIVVIRSTPNSLVPLKPEKKVFKWNLDEYDYSDDAMKYIELLMMEQRAFTVDTSEAVDYSNRRIDIVARCFKATAV